MVPSQCHALSYFTLRSNTFKIFAGLSQLVGIRPTILLDLQCFFSHGGKGSKQIPRQRFQMTNPTGAQPAEEWRAWPSKNTSLSGSVWGEDVQIPQSPYGQGPGVQ